MVILNHSQILQKIKRLSIEILEHNYNEKELYLLGMNQTGYHFAELLAAELKNRYEGPIHIKRVNVNPAKPTSEEVTIEGGTAQLKNKTVLVIDDVANTGRTIFYAFAPLMHILPKKVEVVVLVNRKHKSYPVKVDYLGLELATTVKENIKVDIHTPERYTVSLE